VIRFQAITLDVLLGRQFRRIIQNALQHVDHAADLTR
jgi:hypothetical protein